MLNKHLVIILYFIIRIPFSLCASPISQDEKETDSLYQNISLFSALHPQEKVYLHFDNTSYFMKESIWYKAHIVNAETLIPEVKSKVLYVDLLSQEGILVKRNRHYIEEGMCSGNFYLPDTLNAGYYEVRAYTAWMLNFGRITSPLLIENFLHKDGSILSDFKNVEKRTSEVPSIFSRVLPVYNAIENEEYPTKQMRTRPRINGSSPKEEKQRIKVGFYPEGGHLIEEIDNRIAFELRDKEEKIIAPKYILIETNNYKVLDTLQVVHNGRGTFNINHLHWEIGLKNCHLTISDQNQIYEYPLPTPEKAGVALQADINENQINIQILSKNITSPLFITLQQGGKPVHYQSLGIKDRFQLCFNTDSLQQGVHQLTVFDRAGHIFADRLFFVRKQETVSITLHDHAIKDNHQPYHPEKYSFKIQDRNGKSLPETSFSVAVRDNDMEDLHYSQGNILTNLLLSSEIRGFIQSPEYYFESQDLHHRKALDLLMMIQGWRRYDWQTMAGVKTFKPHYPIEQKLQVKGTVYKRRSSSGELKKWNKEVFVRCQICYPDGYTYDAVQQTKNGDFSFDVVQIYGKHTMFIQAYKNKDKIRKELDYHKRGDSFFYDHYVCKDRVFSPLPKQYNYYETHEKELSTFSFLEQSIDQVTIKDRGKIKIDFTKPDFCYDFIEAIDYINDFGYEFNRSTFTIPLYITELVSPLKGILSGTTHICSGNGEDIEQYYPDSHLSSSDKIRRRDILSFKRLKTICGYFDIRDRSRLIGKTEAHSGKWDFYINYTQRSKKEYLPNMVGDRCYFYGYAPPVQFYSPDYSMQLPDKPDHRRTLYWNPDIKTDKNGNASIQFYNNATCKKMIISAEGITKDGQPFYLNTAK